MNCLEVRLGPLWGLQEGWGLGGERENVINHTGSCGCHRLAVVGDRQQSYVCLTAMMSVCPSQAVGATNGLYPLPPPTPAPALPCPWVRTCTSPFTLATQCMASPTSSEPLNAHVWEAGGLGPSLTLPLPSCVYLGKALALFGPWFLYLYHREGLGSSES